MLLQTASLALAGVEIESGCWDTSSVICVGRQGKVKLRMSFKYKPVLQHAHSCTALCVLAHALSKSFVQNECV